MDHNALLDLGYVGNMFTCSNRRTGSMNIAERLNHGIANNQWKMIYPNAVITHLIASHLPQTHSVSPRFSYAISTKAFQV